MQLASYHSTRPGLQGIANRLIRWRLRGPYSHNEIIFEPGDGVDDLMPDGSCAPVDGALWCVSSVAAERMPAWSRRRPGALGGVRFKRVKIDPAKWDVIPLPGSARDAATRASVCEGEMYDWQLIAGFLNWLIPDKSGRWTCNELCAWCAGILDPWRFDPCALHAVAHAMGRAQHDA